MNDQFCDYCGKEFLEVTVSSGDKQYCSFVCFILCERDTTGESVTEILDRTEGGDENVRYMRVLPKGTGLQVAKAS